MEIRYITIEDVCEIHKKTIQYSGGGLLQPRDLGPLEGALAHIQNDDYYPTFAKNWLICFFAHVSFIVSLMEISASL